MAFCTRHRDQTAMKPYSLMAHHARVQVGIQAAVALIMGLLSGCASTPPTPDWQSNAHAWLNSFTQAYLSGKQTLSEAALVRAKLEVAQTGRPDVMARLELAHCAVQIASLVRTDCPAYQALAVDAKASETAYAAFLSGDWRGLQAHQLPDQYRVFFKAALTMAATPTASASDLSNTTERSVLLHIAKPLSRLVAAGVLQARGQLSAADTQVASDTASAQGWRRPLLAWLGLQLLAAQTQGDTQNADVLQRRINLIVQAQP